MRGSTWNRAGGSSPDRPPIDAQPVALGYAQGFPNRTRPAFHVEPDGHTGSAGGGPWFTLSSP